MIHARSPSLGCLIVVFAWLVDSGSGSTWFLLKADIPVYGRKASEIPAMILDIAQKMCLEFDHDFLTRPGTQVEIKALEGLLSQSALL